MAAGCQRKSWLWDPRSLTLHLFAESKSRQVLLLYSNSICGIWGMRHTLRMSYFLNPAPVASFNLLAFLLFVMSEWMCVMWGMWGMQCLPLGPFPSYWKHLWVIFIELLYAPSSVGENSSHKYVAQKCAINLAGYFYL